MSAAPGSAEPAGLGATEHTTLPTCFNIVVGNHNPTFQESLSDLATLVEEGLRSLGFSLSYSTRALAPAPCINLIVEQFADPSFCDRIEALKRLYADDLRIGLIGSEDLEDTYVMSGLRRTGLHRLAPHFDFVWTLSPQVEIYRRLCGHDRVALLELGFIEGTAAAEGARDLDVLWYGREGSFVDACLSSLRSRGLRVASTGGTAPSFVRRNLLRRAKVLIDCRTHASDRFASVTRISCGLNAGAAVVAECFDDSPLASLYDYVMPARSGGELADVVDALVTGGGWRAAAECGQFAFRTRRPMSAMLKPALAVVPALLQPSPLGN